ncbi:hypothetical protein QR680_004693 [Steinernema hermaphroditum]|uniref:Uncharacterized protein n=1 Tax=Steinernema hermaphroditum TaxID=289476 RepID=A0AA39HPI3_9BILA|nr:hypothetical protein QR680_004693 [Steinernema hermaphroditum]
MALKQSLRELALNSIDISVSTTNAPADQSRSISSLLSHKRSDEFIEVHYDKLKHTLLKLIDHPPNQDKIIAKHVQVSIDKSTAVKSTAVAKDLHKVIEKFCSVESVLFHHIDLLFERSDRKFFAASIVEKLGGPFPNHRSKHLQLTVSVSKENSLRITTEVSLPYTIIKRPAPDLDDKQQLCLQTNAHKPCRYALWSEDVPVELGHIYGNGNNRANHYFWKSQLTSPLYIAFAVEETRKFPIGWLSCVHPFDNQLHSDYWTIPFDVRWLTEF